MIITYEGQTIQIIEDKYKVINDTLYAEGINKTNSTVYNQTVDVKTALSDIRYVKIEELDGLKTTGCVIGSTGAILLLVLIAVAASQPRSCEGPKSWSNQN